MDQDRTHLLIAKYVAGETTAEELEELERAFIANPELRRLAELLPELKQAPPKGVTLGRGATDAGAGFGAVAAEGHGRGIAFAGLAGGAADWRGGTGDR